MNIVAEIYEVEGDGTMTNLLGTSIAAALTDSIAGHSLQIVINNDIALQPGAALRGTR